MTTPGSDQPTPHGDERDPSSEAAGETGALAAASEDGADYDPLAPMDAVSESDLPE